MKFEERYSRIKRTHNALLKRGTELYLVAMEFMKGMKTLFLPENIFL